MKGSTILVTNLEYALALAIQALKEAEERHYGPTFKSATRQGFEDNLECLKSGFEPRIVYS